VESSPLKRWSVAPGVAGSPGAPARYYAPVLRPVEPQSSEAAFRVRLGLQRGASGNLRRHLVRAIRRVVVLVLGDLAAFLVARSLVRAVRDYGALGASAAGTLGGLMPRGILSGVQYLTALFVALAATGNYGEGDQRHDARRVFVACALATALPLWMTAWTQGLEPVLVQYALTTLLMWVALALERSTIDRVVARVLPAMRRAAPTLFVGPAEECRTAMAKHVFRRGGEYRSVGFVDTGIPSAEGALGHVADFPELLQWCRAETVVICGYLRDTRFHDVVDASVAAGTHILSVPRAVAVAGVTPLLAWRDGEPLIELSRPALKSRQLFLKRTLDVVGAGLGLLFLAPLFAVIALAVRLGSRGPAIFAHERLGKNGQSFRCYKFRSMHVDAHTRLRSDDALYAEYVANNFKLPEEADPRLTRVGRFLRRTSLDELPQLINVLRGDMSLVGPRPIVTEEIDHYGHGGPAFLSLQPGMTGAWQINGRSQVGYPQRADIELDYVRNWSLGGDIAILLKTVPAVLGRRGAH